MVVTFETGLGLPTKCKVKYDEQTNLLSGFTDRRRIRSCCKVVSTDLDLKVYFTVVGGEFIGIEYKCSLEALPAASLTMPETVDGFVKMGKQPYTMKRINIVALNQTVAKYDSENKILLIGEEKDDVLFYKVGKNLAFGVDVDGRLCNILINI
ncbi:MAG: hypothetical protein ACI4MN_00515 [Candidatus Coproplasma sp.]